ncbi:UDP-glucose 4-epimerase GalE [Opitutus terrae]|uniref:UDP-glucose 4-epimerase n=1 Tax=Opitutus terrae (strain DSM 11246 / JCM 15787 / PB90-1) TaxID=452637 RepID=B1ZYA6_OPITP|nr:UDP-glucose 4-epimerase GalE [Opitutus terrae]ACB76252.1 UDP-glucose 4-epimerase [Opitutus terrae PB90-1]
MTILVTGAAGYIGSHTLVALLESGHQPVALDNYANSKPEALRRVSEITGKTFPIYEGDACDRGALERIFREQRIDAAIHFAGLKAVGESVRIPLRYYENNLISTLALLQTMAAHECFRLVFSSSATVYGDPKILPIPENAPLSATNPYGRTKLFIEEILRDLAVSDGRWKIALLRYFNPVGAHPSGRIGEDPKGVPNNLFPFIAQVATGRLPELKVFGGDYPTPDGTGVRDYLHVCDLAEGHVRAVEKLDTFNGAEALNLGTGQGTSVLEAVRAFESAAGRPLPHRIVARRSGDVAACYADPAAAHARLGWKATRTLADMMKDLWRWQSNNPNGLE